jgi:hypothetical protein
MSKKDVYDSNFFAPDPNDPIYNILAAGGNMVVGYGLKWVSREIANAMGLSGVSVEKQIALNRSKLGLQKMEIEVAKSREEKDKLMKLLDLRVSQKEIEIRRSKLRLEEVEAQQSQLIVPVPTQVICGALATGASSEGLVGPPDQVEACQRWLDSNWDGGTTITVLGKKGSGKTVMVARTAEYGHAVHKKQVFWIGLPPEARLLLPVWINMADSVEQCPPSSIVICDEAGINYLSLCFASDRNVLMRKQLMLARHKNCVMIFACQSSRDMDASILRMSDSFIWKEPGLHQPLSERTDMRLMAKKAALAFGQIPREERCQVGYVFSDDFEGAVRCSVPSFWSEELSHIYANLDLTKIQEQGVKRQELQKVTVEETKSLNSASQEKQIMDLRRKDYSIKRIANELNCTTWRVRQVLEQAVKEQ